MNDTIRTDIIRIFSDCLNMIEKADVYGLEDLSDHVIHNASIFQDPDSTSAAVIIYAISKMYRKDHDINSIIIQRMGKVKANLENNRLNQYRDSLKNLYKEIITQGTKLGDYIDEVLTRAKIKKGSKVYYHGISLSQSAQVLGVDIWDLMSYVGKTQIADTFTERSDVRNRLSLARSLFIGK